MNEYVIIILPLADEDGGGFVGLVPDLQGCMSDGESRDEALANTQQAMIEWIEHQKARGIDLPKPGVSIERASEQRKSLLRALKAMMSYMEEADGRIAELEKALEEAVDGISNSWEKNLPLFESADARIYRSRPKVAH
jgi:antitoxin HicB|uniref:type II toxin-antitoxin system HicB family antitoxin n=1 Tax=Roseovarius sp. BRH_c41 TaxID=1629709 RepID=UPI000AD08486|nr:type II toxin-antitoxin system HicB family antitoxin [Roseovarius sp. BRH_c41]